MGQDERRRQLHAVARAYFEGLAKKNFGLIPYHDTVSLRRHSLPAAFTTRS
jgi:hypothetical protein